jgi:hypothetical protein
LEAEGALEAQTVIKDFGLEIIIGMFLIVIA